MTIPRAERLRITQEVFKQWQGISKTTTVKLDYLAN